jgi:hypothetical protein
VSKTLIIEAMEPFGLAATLDAQLKEIKLVSQLTAQRLRRILETYSGHDLNALQQLMLQCSNTVTILNTISSFSADYGSLALQGDLDSLRMMLSHYQGVFTEIQEKMKPFEQSPVAVRFKAVFRRSGLEIALKRVSEINQNLTVMMSLFML